MKKSFLIVAAATFSLVSCNKNESPFVGEDPNEQGNAFLQTDYNLNMRNFALAVNEAINTNKSFRIFIKEEVNKMFDGDYEILLSDIVDSKVENFETDGNGIVTRAGGNISVRDLLNSSFRKVQEKAIAKGDYSFSEQSRAPAQSLVDQLTEQYPNLQIAVPVHVDNLDNPDYIPPVTFIPEEYVENETPSVTAYKDSFKFPLDAIKVPDSAVVVIGLNERDFPLVVTDYEISSPLNLSAQKTANGIALNWVRPTITNGLIGYRVYHKSSTDAEFLPLANVNGISNLAYFDLTTQAGLTYFYYVTAYNMMNESDESNIVSEVGVGPAELSSFTANAITNNYNELRWTVSGYNYTKVKLFKRIVGANYLPYKEYDKLTFDDFDNVSSGQKITYKMQTVGSDNSLSNPKYDIVYVPYRNPSLPSPVRIKEITCNLGDIEGWLQGNPEFLIKVTCINGQDPTKFATIQDEILCEYGGSMWDRYGTEYFNKLVYNWWPSLWYETLAFTVIEADGGDGVEVSTSIQYNYKNPEQDNLQTTIGNTTKVTFSEDGNRVGTAYLNYYDQCVDKWLEFPNYGVKMRISNQ